MESMKSEINAIQQQEEEKNMKEEKDQEERRFHILVVEDNRFESMVLEKKLRKRYSYEVTCVESGEKAMEYLGLLHHDGSTKPASSSSSSSSSSQQHQGPKVDLIMIDFCMPEMNGYDVLRRVKESAWKDVPVVMMSSEYVAERVTRCKEGGAEDFLIKPLMSYDLQIIKPLLLKSVPDS